MRISIIVAVANNGVIGRDNDLVWRLRDDMKFFSKTTRGHVVITGRKNYESIPEKFRPLPHRDNIVITRNLEYEAPGGHGSTCTPAQNAPAGQGSYTRRAVVTL